MEEAKLKWFAARAIREKSYVLKYLDSRGARHAGIGDIPSLVFIQCSDTFIKLVRYELYGRLMVYCCAQKHTPQPVSDDVMESFLRMASIHEEPVSLISVVDESIFEGKRKMVTKGVFAGCVGVIKRIKGERRLIMKVGDSAAIATPYIPQDFLEDIE